MNSLTLWPLTCCFFTQLGAVTAGRLVNTVKLPGNQWRITSAANKKKSSAHNAP